jgi:thymidylate kinase
MKILNRFNKDRIDWSILSGYEDYSSKISSDVDIIVRPADYNKVFPIINDIPNLKVVQIRNYEYLSTSYNVVDESDEKLETLQLDICCDFRSGGQVFLIADEILKRKRLYNRHFYVPPIDLEFIYYLLKKLSKSKFLGVNSFKKEHQKKLRDLFKEDIIGCEQQLQRFFPKTERKLIIKACSQGDWSYVSNHFNEIRSSMIKKNFLNNPFQTINYYFFEVYRTLNRIMRPSGLFVVFLGPDGSGKSTVIEEVETKLAPYFSKITRKHLLPRFLKLKRKSISQNDNVSNPHAKPPRGALASILKILYWCCDNITYYFWRLIPLKVRSTFIIFDRYYLDLLVDPKRYRYGGSQFIAKLIYRFVPKPDMIIILDAPSEILYSRKKEVSMEEIESQRKRYKGLTEEYNNAHVVDTSKELESSVSEVEKLIINHLAERSSRRMKYDIK